MELLLILSMMDIIKHSMRLFDFYELDCYWDNALYFELLLVSGGKERLSHYLNNYNPKLKWLLSESDIANIHNKKN